MAAEPSPLIAEARKRWTRCAEAEDAQRKAILLAKEFRALKQWPDAIRLAREGAGSLAGQPPQPPRPCLVVDRLSQPVRAVSNQIKNADFGFDVMPNGKGADIDTADIMKGYLRRMENQSRGESPVEWAADGAIEGGLGWLRMSSDYVHENWEGDPNDPEAYDQELCLKRIPNSLSVYCDPSAMHPTRRDARYLFIVEDLDKDAFKDTYPKADLRGLEEFQGTGDMAAWVSKDMIRVAEYWRVQFERKTIASTDGKYRRELRIPRVKGSIINAVEELAPLSWLGRRIPVFPVLGEELNVDGRVVLRGIIAMGMDAQRMVNYTYSGAIEIFALAPRKAPKVVAESIANYKSVWDNRNIYNFAYHPYDQWSSDGLRELNPPQDDLSEAPIAAAVELMRISEEAIKASTSTGDASLGNTNPNERSGRALEALQSQSDLANSNYADNVKRTLIDVADEAVYVIPKITRPGQILHILGMDDEAEQVMIGQPFEQGPDGTPQPVNVSPEIAKLKTNAYKFYDPAAGRYATTVTVGKASATRMQEGSRALGELIPHLPPEMAAAVTPDYIRQLSFPGAQGIAETLENVLPANLRPKKEGEPTALPPEAQQQIDALTQQLQEAQQIIQTDQVKQQAAITKAQIDTESREHIAAANNETKLAVAELGAKIERLSLFFEERARLGVQAHEASMAAMGHAASADAQTADQAHAADMQSDAQRAAAEQAAANSKESTNP